MPTAGRSIVTMRLSDGTLLDNWTSVSLRDTFTDPLGDYAFEFRPPFQRIQQYSDSIVKGDLVGVAVDEVVQGAFLIQSVTRRIDRDGVTFQVHCQSVLATAYEGSVDPDISKAYKTDTPVTDVILEALAPFSNSAFKSITADTAGSRAAMSGKAIGGARAEFDVNALKHKDAQAQEGESAYAFCSRIFNRLGVALRVNHLGELTLSAPDYEQQPSYSLVQDMDGVNPGNRMLDGITIEDTNEGQFSECVVRGQGGDGGGQTRIAQPIGRVVVTGTSLGTEPYKNVPRELEDFGGHVYQSRNAVAPYKPKYILDKNARDNKRCVSVAKLAMGLAAAKAFVITCEVDGMRSKEGRVWTVDTIANVLISAIGLQEPMWIMERCLMIDRNGGQRTRLKLLPVGALVIGDLPS